MSRIGSIGRAALLCAAILLARSAAAEDDPKFAATSHLYDTYCAQCHGLQRNGKGVNTGALSVQPRDHSDHKGMVSIPIDELTKAITEGGTSVNKSVLMPPWGKVLSASQITDLVAYLRHVCGCDTAQ